MSDKAEPVRTITVRETAQGDSGALVRGTDYADGTLLDWHRHADAQLLYAATGSMHVDTRNGSWIVPPQRAVWIPAGEPHRVLMRRASTRSLYVDAARAPRPDTQCSVLQVGDLLRQLLIAAAETGTGPDRRERNAALHSLLLQEIRHASALPLHVPIPADARLATLCRAYLHAPDIRVSPDDWARALHLGRRSFYRLFRRETATTFGEWCRRACVIAALGRLAGGTSVTEIALDQGYENPAAFTTMFGKIAGQPPSAFLPGRRAGEGA